MSARPIGPPARLYRLARSPRGNWFVQTYNRYTRQWRMAGRTRAEILANIQVSMGIAAWTEARDAE